MRRVARRTRSKFQVQPVQLASTPKACSSMLRTAMMFVDPLWMGWARCHDTVFCCTRFVEFLGLSLVHWASTHLRAVPWVGGAEHPPRLPKHLEVQWCRLLYLPSILKDRRLAGPERLRGPDEEQCQKLRRREGGGLWLSTGRRPHEATTNVTVVEHRA